MNKKLGENEPELEGELPAVGSARPVRNSSTSRKTTSHSSSKRKRSKANRKNNTAGGIHQRGDKRVLR